MRAGMGAHFGAKLIENCPIDLFAERYEGTILAADARGGEDLFAADDYASGPVCWILGAEGPGRVVGSPRQNAVPLLYSDRRSLRKPQRRGGRGRVSL